MNTGVIIARCQVHELHAGHLALLAEVTARHQRLVILLGVSKIPNTRNNPLDFQTRVQMMRDHVPDAVFLPVQDMPGDDDGWSDQVDRILGALLPTETFLLYGGPDSFIGSYLGKWPTHVLGLVPQTRRGTELRELAASRPLDNPSFRAGVIYASANRFPPVHSVVDLAIVKHGEGCKSPDGCQPFVLMGRKSSESEPNRYRLIGGFVDSADRSLAVAAAREGAEETGNMSFSTPIYIDSMRILDRRFIGTGEGVMTTLFWAQYVSGQPVASDDMAVLKWIPLQQCESLAIDIHKPLAKRLIEHLHVNSIHAEAA